MGDTMYDRSGKYASGLILFALLMAECSAGYEYTMVFSAIPTFIKLFGDPIKVGWLVTAFLLVSASATAIVARLGDIYGRRRVLLILLVIALLGSLSSALSESLNWIIAGRAVQGIAAAALPLCIGLVRENFASDRVPLMVGFILAAASVSAGAGLVIGGYIVDNYAWQVLFYSSVGLAALGFVLVWVFIPPSKPAGLTGPIDFTGGVLFILPVAGVMYALANVKAWGLLDERTLGLIAISALLFFTWVMYELRHKEPLLDIRLLANRQVALANISIVLAGLGSLQIYLVFSMFLQQPSWSGVGLGLTATVAGVMMLPSQLASVISSPFSGWVASRFTARDAALIGVLTMMIAWGGLFLHHSGLWYISGAILIAAIGLQIVYTALPNLIVEAVPENRTSEATGMLQVLRAASTGVGGLVVILLMNSYIVSSPEAGQNASYPSSASYRLVFGFVFCCCFLMLLAVLALPRRHKHYEVRRRSPAVDTVYKR